MKQIKCKINNSKIPKGQRQLKNKQTKQKQKTVRDREGDTEEKDRQNAHHY